MTEQRTYRRVLRREQYRSRSFAVIIALLLVSIGLAYAATETALAALGFSPLLLAPATVVEAINAPSTTVLIGAGAAALFGLVLILIAITPGRRARHSLPHERLAIVVDDPVLAGAIGRSARVVASVPAERVRTTISRRRAAIAVTPSSGFRVDGAEVEAAARDLIERLAPAPRVQVAATISTVGVVGS